MMVEDIMHTGDGSTHCDVPTTLARTIYISSMANDIPPPFFWSLLGWTHVGLHEHPFPVLPENKEQKPVNMVCYPVHNVACRVLQSTLYSQSRFWAGWHIWWSIRSLCCEWQCFNMAYVTYVRLCYAEDHVQCILKVPFALQNVRKGNICWDLSLLSMCQFSLVYKIKE